MWGLVVVFVYLRMQKEAMTLLWEGRIDYHNYTEDSWVAIDNVDHPLFKIMIKKIKQSLPEYNDYKIYVVGGLLEDWLSWDVDFVVCGKYDQKEIYYVLDTIVRVGFSLNIFCDVHYIKEDIPWDINNWDGINYKQYDIYHISNKFIKEGVPSKADLSYSPEGILFKLKWSLPLGKQVDKYKQGYKYSPPLRVI